MIIAVAGFGILAIFSMIVVEKTRDIGVMKALGASTGGIRGDLPGLRLAPGAVGSGVGLGGGLLFVQYINEIEKFLSQVFIARSLTTPFTTSTRSRPRSCRHTVIGIVAGARA